jgi:hypothetical protein
MEIEKGNMNKKEAIETLEKLKEFEGKVKLYKTELVIHLFEIVPLKYMKDNKIELSIQEILNYDRTYFEKFPNNIEFNIIAIHCLNEGGYVKDLKGKRYLHLINL